MDDSNANYQHSEYEESINQQNIRVLLRIRSLNSKEEARRDSVVIDAGQFTPPSQLQFDTVFDENASQEDIYANSGIQALIQRAIEGYAVTILAYGQTGSGKTYTITGPDSQKKSIDPSHQEAGLVARALHSLHSELDSKKDMNLSMKASYYEIYNEHVKDLLRPKNNSLPVRWSLETGFFVENLFMVDCEVLDDFLVVLEEGLMNRKTAAHNMNDAKGEPIQRVGQISFVDLAGSEKVKETKTTGEALSETMNINKSLLTLGSCIAALSDSKKKDGHIPFRDSKLTKLLHDSLGGNGFVLMIACVSPSFYSLSETQSTLRYAQRAKHIKAIPMIKTNDPQEELISRLKRDLKIANADLSLVRAAVGDSTFQEIMHNNNRHRSSHQSHSISGDVSSLYQTKSNQSHSNSASYSHPEQNQFYHADYENNQYESIYSDQIQDRYGYSPDYGKEHESEDSFYAFAHPSKNVKLATEKKTTVKTDQDLSPTKQKVKR